MGWQFYDSSGRKLNTTSTLIDNLAIDGATDIGANIVDAALFIIDDGAGGTNRKTAASRLKTYIGSAPSQAVEADIEGQTNQDTYVPPDLLRHVPGVAKAWARFSQAGSHSFKAEYGMASISDEGAGLSDITVDDAFTAGATNYVVMAGGTNHVTTDQASTTTTVVRVNNRDNSHASEDAGDIYVAYWGLI